MIFWREVFFNTPLKNALVGCNTAKVQVSPVRSVAYPLHLSADMLCKYNFKKGLNNPAFTLGIEPSYAGHNTITPVVLGGSRRRGGGSHVKGALNM